MQEGLTISYPEELLTLTLSISISLNLSACNGLNKGVSNFISKGVLIERPDIFRSHSFKKDDKMFEEIVVAEDIAHDHTVAIEVKALNQNIISAKFDNKYSSQITSNMKNNVLKAQKVSNIVHLPGSYVKNLNLLRKKDSNGLLDKKATAMTNNLLVQCHKIIIKSSKIQLRQ